MAMRADLHIHTTASDGRLTPVEIIQYAHKAGLSYIAITDHDTLDGITSLDKLVLPAIKIIPGIEFSTDLPEREVHILGYNIDLGNECLIQQLMILKNSRLMRIHHILKKLNDLGYHIDFEHVKSIASQSSSIGRPHIAKALVEKKYFSSITEAFDKILNKNGPAYVEHYKMSVDNVVSLIRQAGGLAVLAHPGLVNDDNLVYHLIQKVDGLEVYHPSHTETHTKLYLEMAKQYDLIITGGSDFHAIPSRYPEKLGIFTVDAALAIQLSKITGVRH